MSFDKIGSGFGLFEVDVHAGTLIRQGRRVRLQEQPFQVLVALLRAARQSGAARAAAGGGLWPGDTFVEFDKSLGVALSDFRAALGDEAANPRFIETVPKRGYRFVPITVCLTRPLSNPPPSRPRRSRRAGRGPPHNRSPSPVSSGNRRVNLLADRWSGRVLVLAIHEAMGV